MKLLKSELEFTSALILTHTMQSKKALEAWLAFIESYQGQRSEAMRLLHARGFRDRLQSYDGTNILEAQELMSDSHRRLKQGKKADPLTKNQDRIISIMDEIINQSLIQSFILQLLLSS